jgi:tyrosine-specific transport protein
MCALIISYFLLCGCLPEHVEIDRLLHQDLLASFGALPVIMTSFGYHIIIPTLVTYMNHKASLLRKTLLIGSAIPFIVYLLWQTLALGSLPLSALTTAWQTGEPITESLASSFHSPWIGSIARFFSFFAIITSFLGISLSLSDFLTDGFKIKKTWEGKLLAIGLTFIPPLVFIFSCKNSFYVALDYAGAFVAILLGILPSLMALSLKEHRWYQSLYGRTMVYLVIFLCFVIVMINILDQQGYLKPLFEPYLK